MESSPKMKSPAQEIDLLPVGRLSGKRLLFIGSTSTKDYVWESAARAGIECCVVGTDPADTTKGKGLKYLHYDIGNHSDDLTHTEVIANYVTSQLGDVDGCLTLMDCYVPLTALVCERLGKPGISYASARAANNKSLTLETLSKKATPGVHQQYLSRWCSLERVEDLTTAANVVGFPAVMKKESSCSGVSIHFVRNIQDAEKHLHQMQNICKSLSQSREWISMNVGANFGCGCLLMEYLEGSEHCVDLAMFHGDLLCAFVTDKGPHGLASGKFSHSFSIIPSRLPRPREVEVIQAAVDCCRGLGLHHGVFDVDIMLTECGPKLIEINPRVGGFCQQEYILRCYGVDLVHLACLLACDVRPTLPSCPSIHEENDTLLPERGVSFPEASKPDVYNSTTQDNSLKDGQARGQQRTDMASLDLKPHGSLVGLKLYPDKHEQALKTTASPATLQKMHQDGQLLFSRHGIVEPETEDSPLPPYCTIGVHGYSFTDACRQLQQYCMELGIVSPELWSVQKENSGSTIDLDTASEKM